jgi:hypothetical protein
MGISDPDFGKCFDTLQRSAENFRSTLYAFVLIYGALLMWTLNAYVYPAEQNRLGMLQQQAAEFIRCLQQAEELAPLLTQNDLERHTANWQQLGETCRERLPATLYFTERLGRGSNAQGNSKVSDADIQKADLSLYTNQVSIQQQKAAEIAEFHVPFVGIVSDRSWLWLVNCTLGLFFYQLIKDQLANLHRLLQFLAARIENNPARQVLLATSQVITSTSITLRGQHSRVKTPIIAGVLAMPIVAAIFLIGDWLYLLLRPDPTPVSVLWISLSRTFLHEPEAYGGLVAIAVLFLELLLYTQIVRQVRRLMRLHDHIGLPLDATSAIADDHQPPSTPIACPVTNAAASEAR